MSKTWKEKMADDTAYASQFPQYIGNMIDRPEPKKCERPKKKGQLDHCSCYWNSDDLSCCWCGHQLVNSRCVYNG